MNKTIIALAVAMLPAAAMADVVIYGEAGAALENTKTTIDGKSNGSVTGVENYNSKIGFKGSEDLGNGLKAVWQVEQKIGIDGTGDNTWATRDSFVGLSGDFGTVQLGRLSNFQNIYSNLDPWKYDAGWNGLGWGAEETNGVGGGVAGFQSRMNNAIAYTTPEWNGFLARAMYSAAGESHVDTAQNQTSNVWEIGLRYAFDAFYGQYSYTQAKNASLLGATKDSNNNPIEANIKNKMHYLEAGYDANNLLVALTYLQTQDEGINGNTSDGKQKQAGLLAAYTIGQFVPHFQYAHGWETTDNGVDNTGTDYNQYVLGLDYLLSKRTKAHVSAGYVKSGDDAAGVTLLKGKTYAAGLTHLF